MPLDFSRITVLIIDDFQNMRTTLRKMLQSIGVSEIDTAANGKEGIECLGRRAYDVVLCDYNLGEGKDGQQVLEEAKHRRLIGYSSVFVMITAENTMEMVMGAMEYKPDDYLTKPFNKDLLKSRLEKLVARKRDFVPIEKAIGAQDYSRAIALCDALSERSPRSRSELLRVKAELLVEAGEYEAAKAVCEQVLAVRNLPWARLILGKALFHSGDLTAARDLFQRLKDENRSYMEAYDWLARTLMALNESASAQEVLLQAVELSPKAILRQRMLGDLATQNEDFTVAERAFRRAAGLGRESVYRNPVDFAGLARSLVKNGAGSEAVKTLHRMRTEFKGEAEGSLKAALTAGEVFKALDREAEARAAVEEAAQRYAELGGAVSPELSLDMAKGYLLAGDREKGIALMQEVARNHHENEALLAAAGRVFREAGMEEEGQRLIADAREEVRRLNNEGVALFKSGEVEKAIRLFEEAASRMPDNRAVNLNAAQVLLVKMQKEGREESALRKAGDYLGRVGKRHPTNPTYMKLRQVYRELGGEEVQ